MRKHYTSVAACAMLAMTLTGCGNSPAQEVKNTETEYESSYDTDGDHDSSSNYSSDDYSRNSESDYDSDSDSDYEYLHDEDSGISGVMNNDGEGIFTGDDFAMRRNEDGTSVATDGKGNWVADSDGDGKVDSISVDGGDTWF